MIKPMSARVAVVICLLLGLLSGAHATRRRNKGVRPRRTCIVDDFQVQGDFDIQQYVGTWYTVAKSDASSSSFHRRSHYSLQEDGVLAMTTRRVSPQNGCSNGMQFEADATLPEGSTTPSKLLLQPRDIPVPPEDYWVIYTDYVDHALVYSCSERNRDGTCAPDRDQVWFLGRAGVLSTEARHHMESFLRGLCVNVDRMVDIPTDCDAELGLSMAHGHDEMEHPSTCIVNDIQTMANFDKEQYTGTWYVIAHLEADVYPYHRISQYTLDEQNSFRMLTHRITSPGQCATAWRFEGQAYNPESSETTSKLVLKPFGMPVYGEDYWVIYTDYTDHALTYSCRERNEDGTCKATHAWMMSRNPTLTATARSHMEMLLTEMCVDVSRLVNTPEECDELLGPESLIDEGPANECVVHSFETMENFDKEQYQGTWYVISHLEESVYPYQRISNYTLEMDGSLTMATERITEQGACDTAMRFEATASQPEGSTSASKLSLKPRGMDVEGEDYWVIYTDYNHYALVYSCGTKNLDGTCQEESIKVWLLSRHPMMSDFARSYLVSLLRGLCVDPRDLVDTPSECDEALGVARADRCDVDKFSVMQDFDASQYMGSWYVFKSLRPDVHPYQRISQYSLNSDGSILMTADGIQDGPMQCETSWHFEARATAVDPASSNAKLTLKPIGIPAPGEDYWVIYTDYTDHALVYSCNDRKLDGTCKEGATHAYILSRNTTLSTQAIHHVNMLLERVCVDPNDMVLVPDECDPTLEMGIRRPVVELTKSCVVDDLPIMEDFDIERYAGVWYTVSQIQPFEYPFHRVSNYTLQDNGRLLMSTDQFFRPKTCDTMHFEAHAFHQPQEGEETNPTSGKLFLQPLNARIPPGNYWVAYTDYTDHALVYSCIRKNVSGECLKGHSMAWFMSRNPGLTEGAITHMKDLLRQLCVNPARLSNVITECDEEIGISSAPAKSPCDISTFQVKQDFVIDKFLGDWYELSHTRGADQYMVLPDNEKMTISPPSEDSDGHFSITMKNVRLNGECGEDDMPGKGWIGQADPAKIVVSFPSIPDGYQVPQVVNHWVLDTDYDNYAITYTCHRIRRDGTCDPTALGLWILGRERQIQPRFWATVQSVIENACVDQAAVQANPPPCPTDPAPEPEPADVVACADVGFGCCLLSGEAAVDADFSNCPRAAPPVAGQMIPEAPVSIVQGQVVCEHHMNCKMFCRFGFKRNSDNCEICACAKEPIRASNNHHHQGGQCQVRLDIVLAKLGSDAPRVGFYVPQCDTEGNYTPVQCPAGTPDACWCANRLTGQRIGKATYTQDTPSCQDEP